jgi:hypothetical protein
MGKIRVRKKIARSRDAAAESQQELFSRLGSDTSALARLAAVRARWAATLREAAATFAAVKGKDTIPPTLPRGGGATPAY